MFIVLLRFAEQRSRASEFLTGHQAWLDRGFSEGIFLLSGSLAQRSGGVVLAVAPSRAEIEARVGADPFVQEGVVTAEILEVSASRANEQLQFLVQEIA